jgi:hypothetical protein
MTSTPTAAPAAATIAEPGTRELQGNFVVLRADKLRLLLPQADVGTASHLDAQPQATDLPGLFERMSGDGGSALIALSHDMLPLDAYPADRFLITAIETPMGEIGFGWSEVSVLIDARLQAKPVPQVLLDPHTPVNEFVELDGEVVFCSDRERLAAHVFADQV